MFDPTIGQFLSEDPLSFDAGDPNLRRYVSNNATNATDPSGLEGIRVGPDRRSAEITIKDTAGNAWLIQSTYDEPKKFSTFMDASGSPPKLHSQFTLKITFLPACPEKFDGRIKLARAKQVFSWEERGHLRKLETTVGGKQWSMEVDRAFKQLEAQTTYFFGDNPEDAERGTIGHLPALNSDNYSIYPKGRHRLDAFDPAWLKLGFNRNEFQPPLSREMVIGSYAEDGNTEGWKSFLPIRVLLAPNKNDKRFFDMAVGVRKPAPNSATFMKARTQFWKEITPRRETNDWLVGWEKWFGLHK